MKATAIILSVLLQTWSGHYVFAADSTQLANSFSKATDQFADYNGVSGEAPADDPLSSNDYNQKNLDLTAIIWADSEISQKLCKPVVTMPATYVAWWASVNKYVSAEKTRNTITLGKQEALKKKIEEIKNSNEYNVQIDALRIQIEALNIIIDSVSGSNLSGGDSNESISRIGSRQELLAAALKAEENTIAEDKKFLDTYNSCLSGIEVSRSVSTTACSTSTAGCARTKTVCSEKSCNTYPDPVPGSCELKAASCMMVSANLPLFERVPVVDLKQLYTMAPVPSKEMNERLLRIISIMDQEINIFFAKSPDPSYDWLTPLEACTGPVKKLIEVTGIMCPTGAKAGKDYKQESFDTLGRSDDFFAESAHYTVGEPWPTGSPGYLHAKDNFNKVLEIVSKDEANKNKSAKEIENLTLNKMWAEFVIPGAYTQNFINGRDTQYGINQDEAVAFAKKVMADHNVTKVTCDETICQSPLIQETPKVVEIPDYAKVTESAKKFLDAVGIKDSLGTEMNAYLSDKWNQSDLIIGQTNHRQHYFKYIEEQLKSLVASDSSKLAALLVRRKTLIENYESLIKALNKGAVGKNTATLAVTNTAKKYNTGTDQILDATSRSLQNSNPNAAIGELSKMALNTTGNSVGSNSHDNLSQASSGLVSYMKGSSISAGVNSGASAIKYSKKNNDKIKKSLEKIAALNKGKSKDQLAADKKSYDSFSKKMASKLSDASANTAGSLLSAGSLSGGGSSGASTATANANENSGAIKTASSSFGGSGFGGFSTSPRGGSSGTSRSTGSDGSDSRSEIASNRSSDDNQRIQDAIRAQQERDRALTEPNENDSIFSRLTKAYFRSYEKLK